MLEMDTSTHLIRGAQKHMETANACSSTIDCATEIRTDIEDDVHASRCASSEEQARLSVLALAGLSVGGGVALFGGLLLGVLTHGVGGCWPRC